MGKGLKTLPASPLDVRKLFDLPYGTTQLGATPLGFGGVAPKELSGNLGRWGGAATTHQAAKPKNALDTFALRHEPALSRSHFRIPS
jgi:hypothetical protein